MKLKLMSILRNHEFMSLSLKSEKCDYQRMKFLFFAHANLKTQCKFDLRTCLPFHIK